MTRIALTNEEKALAVPLADTGPDGLLWVYVGPVSVMGSLGPGDPTIVEVGDRAIDARYVDEIKLGFAAWRGPLVLYGIYYRGYPVLMEFTPAATEEGECP